MSINLNDLLGDQSWLLWLALAALLVAARVVVPARWLVPVAGVAVAGAVAAAISPWTSFVVVLVGLAVVVGLGRRRRTPAPA